MNNVNRKFNERDSNRAYRTRETMSNGNRSINRNHTSRYERSRQATGNGNRNANRPDRSMQSMNTVNRKKRNVKKLHPLKNPIRYTLFGILVLIAEICTGVKYIFSYKGRELRQQLFVAAVLLGGIALFLLFITEGIAPKELFKDFKMN